jgi:DNA-binding GntR family transcriptional regulator
MLHAEELHDAYEKDAGKTLSRSPDTPSQVDLCYELLRNMIVRCEIAPGSRLTEKVLIAKLGFGRTPVREALLRLTQDRIVDTKPRSGYRVRPLTYKSVDDFFVAWCAVAPLLAELAFRNLKDSDRKFLQGLSRKQAKLDRDDIEGFREIASGFFERLSQLADSEPLAFIYNRFGAEMDRVFRMFFPTPKGREWTSRYTDVEAWMNCQTAEEARRQISHALREVHTGMLEYIECSVAAGSSLFSKDRGLGTNLSGQAPAKRKAQRKVSTNKV